MFKPLHFYHKEDSQVFFSSDLHVYHDKEFVWKKRQHESIQEHADFVRDTINKTVSKNDYLVLLGDSFLTTTPELALDFFRGLNVDNIVYVNGNHESQVSKMLRKEDELGNVIVSEGYNVLSLNDSGKTMLFLGNLHDITVNNQYIVLCHFPLAIWNHSSRGAWMLCGHSHGGYPKTLPQFPCGKILDIGWDVHRKPLSFTEVEAIMFTKSIVSEDGNH